MIMRRYLYLIIALVLLVNTGCTLDSSGRGSPCGTVPELEGCFARTPDTPTREDPEMYIQIIREDACHLSGQGWGLVVPYTFTSGVVSGGRVILNALGYGDEGSVEHYSMSVELTGGGDGILLTVHYFSVGSDGEWRSWPEPYDRPYHLERTECSEEPGE